eukprot:gb/GECG01009582.1/.p1 GENE.gb/GECG01009582.1/~~gb/GECG01009582.1/.p1  ORF type:complete len:342 (+),score=61.65 gb/GECG01009582.1/:1-1026(+)
MNGEAAWDENRNRIPLDSLQEAVRSQDETRVHDVPAVTTPGDRTVDLKHEPHSNRFELRYRAQHQDEEAVLAAYVEAAFSGGQCPGVSCNPDASKGTLDLYHTWTDPSFRGMKLAEIIVAFAVEYAHAMKFKIVPSCSYVRDGFLSKHPAWKRLSVTDTTHAPYNRVEDYEQRQQERPAENEDDEDEEDDEEAEEDVISRQRHQDHLFRLVWDQYMRKIKSISDISKCDDVKALTRFANTCCSRARDKDTEEESSELTAESSHASMNGSQQKARKRNSGESEDTSVSRIPPEQLTADQLRGIAQQCFRRASELREDVTWLAHPHTADNVDYLSSFGIHING